uniref:Uncharacterized protein LOC111107453 n=1 Tax=Crassostrea virginica TaxID=6565 RepID=A0A8B8B4P1_CRAVI|nr:uncharacterized protein LOC111107453 [Crassostrea virginica]
MDVEENSRYISWAVSKLKQELIARGASTRGRKTDLIERLLAYDRNNNFKSDPVILPTPLEVSWPTKGFQQLTEEHRNLLPSVCQEQIDLYFVHRLAGDKQCCGDFKAIEKGRLLVESDRIFAVSFHASDSSIYFSGIVLRQNSDYYFQIQGQLYISQRHYYYFVVFTFKDFFVQKIEFDRKYCEGSLLPKLDLFYTNHFRPYLFSTF